MSTNDEYWMGLAVTAAKKAACSGEVPVGEVLVIDNELIASAGNSPIRSQDPTAHAEISVIRQACQYIGNYRLTEAVIYVTLEPCVMCIGAMVHARIKRLVYGTPDPKAGAVHSVYHIADDTALNHRIQCTSGVLETECATLLRQFFKEKRTNSRGNAPQTP